MLQTTLRTWRRACFKAALGRRRVVWGVGVAQGGRASSELAGGQKTLSHSVPTFEPKFPCLGQTPCVPVTSPWPPRKSCPSVSPGAPIPLPTLSLPCLPPDNRTVRCPCARLKGHGLTCAAFLGISSLSSVPSLEGPLTDGPASALLGSPGTTWLRAWLSLTP